ncbi:hypothetical protein [Rhizobium phaseoli]|uniref:hypothetical protein n=1 Tax=Rhizobium phaseoli TaxID=396 RepID=UPI000372134A|nr:hypothetical protein [Rhizobium phaseoli]
MDPKRRARSVAFGCDALAVFLKYVDDLGRRVKRLVGGVGNASEEEVEPRFPIALFANLLKQSIIFRPMGLQIEAQVEQRLTQNPVPAKILRDKEATDSPVAI